jgi:hypothetical protein
MDYFRVDRNPDGIVAKAEFRAQGLIEWMAEVAEQRQRKQGNPDQ